jgi:hypothetical protein
MSDSEAQYIERSDIYGVIANEVSEQRSWAQRDKAQYEQSEYGVNQT